MQFELDQARRQIDDAVADFLPNVTGREDEFAAEWLVVVRSGNNLKTIHLITSDDSKSPRTPRVNTMRQLFLDAKKALRL